MLMGLDEDLLGMSSACASFLTSRAEVEKTMSWYLRMKVVKSAGGASPMVGFALEVHRSCAKHPWGPKVAQIAATKKSAFACGPGAPPGRMNRWM